jgi:twitching motility protein PilI
MNNFTIETLNQEKKELGIPYLKLQVDLQTPIALAMEDTQEVLTIPIRRITPIPNMGPKIVGLLNQRNRVFWVADLSLILGLSANRKEKQQYNIAIIKVGKVPLGLLVEEIKGVVRISKNKIQSPVGTVSPHLTPYLQGCLIARQEKLLILDAKAIINSPDLQQTY